MQTRVTRIVVIAAGALAGFSAAGNSYAEQLAPPAGQPFPRVAPIVASYGGLTAWSELAGPAAAPYYALTARVGDQTVRLPVKPRSVPFDVQAGPDEAGRTVLVYSRCAIEPALASRDLARGILAAPGPAYVSGRGCDVYEFDMATMQEHVVSGVSSPGASETLPSIWKGRIAFARVYERRAGRKGVVPYLYLRPSSTARPVRLPGGPRGVSGLPGPTSLAVSDSSVAAVWNYNLNAHEGRSTMRLITHRRSRTIAMDTFAFQRSDYATYTSPTFTAGTLTFGLQRAAGVLATAGPPRPTGTYVISYRLTSHRYVRRRVSLPGMLVSVRPSGSSTIYGYANGEGFVGPLGTIERR